MSSLPMMKLPRPSFDEDEWGQVINGPNTYRAIAIGLKNYGSVAVGWTNETDTHYDLVFSYDYLKGGELQGGLNVGRNLMVAIVRKGCFGFDVTSAIDLHHGYIAEKLNVPDEETAQKLANLIMAVRKYLASS